MRVAFIPKMNSKQMFSLKSQNINISINNINMCAIKLKTTNKNGILGQKCKLFQSLHLYYQKRQKQLLHVLSEAQPLSILTLLCRKCKLFRLCQAATPRSHANFQNPPTRRVRWHHSLLQYLSQVIPFAMLGIIPISDSHAGIWTHQRSEALI